MLIKKDALLLVGLKRRQSTVIDQYEIGTRMLWFRVLLERRWCFRFRTILCQCDHIQKISVMERVKQCISIQPNTWIIQKGRKLTLKEILKECILTQLDSQLTGNDRAAFLRFPSGDLQLEASLLRPFTPVVSENESILKVSQAVRIFSLLSKHSMNMKILANIP